MTAENVQTEQFERQRPQLRALAYPMLGSVSEADDAVQEAWLRLNRSGDGVENVGGWLTTVVGRVCLDMLRARAGDFDALLELLDPEVVFRAEAGNLTGLVTPRIDGVVDVARYAAGQGGRFATLCHPAPVNGAAGLVIRTAKRPIGAVGITVAGGRIVTIDLILDPDKLGSIDVN